MQTPSDQPTHIFPLEFAPVSIASPGTGCVVM
ncbi:uncharacterized protein ANIA_11554 [Aspergillus nidulans FGSC A4]|uniref:Uncharacterized protein n=1 Tax=Emericella nidulans (strain FGSC A4 / ATCC 38163 / CBS 112.46 / NRRL 194 / M139) TaxID=227321 RepID=C8VCL8_EMENI|nr:hypothetical protein [Aspergillus nidulans FGSC A4]CBF78595.1 TPA: hypothetical protein ANIA_11554 [Aspergillus nidulans FGSC A4]